MNRPHFMKRLFIVVAALLVLPGCALLEAFLRDASAAFTQPTFTFRDARLTNYSLGGLDLDTVWDLGNPNDIGISLSSIDYALFIDEKQVVSGQPQNGLQIAARGSSELHFPANIKFVDVAQVVETFLTKDKAKWRAEGHLGVQTPIGEVKLPIAKEDFFEVPKIPAIAFANPRVSGLSLSGATIEFPLTVTNKNTYALPIGNVTGTLSIAGSPVGTLSTGNLGSMQGQGAHQVTLPLTISFISAAGAVVNAIRGGTAPVQFSAQVQSGQTSLPIKFDQPLTFGR
ncbi:MAG: LEA type 2 family protein [Myxococcaceae bacterium]